MVENITLRKTILKETLNTFIGNGAVMERDYRRMECIHLIESGQINIVNNLIIYLNYFLGSMNNTVWVL